MQNYKLGEYIRQRRLDLGLTQEQVCAGICESVTLSRFENGKQTEIESMRFCSALVCRMTDIMRW